MIKTIINGNPKLNLLHVRGKTPWRASRANARTEEDEEGRAEEEVAYVVQRVPLESISQILADPIEKNNCILIYEARERMVGGWMEVNEELLVLHIGVTHIQK